VTLRQRLSDKSQISAATVENSSSRWHRNLTVPHFDDEAQNCRLDSLRRL